MRALANTRKSSDRASCSRGIKRFSWPATLPLGTHRYLFLCPARHAGPPSSFPGVDVARVFMELVNDVGSDQDGVGSSVPRRDCRAFGTDPLASTRSIRIDARAFASAAGAHDSLARFLDMPTLHPECPAGGGEARRESKTLTLRVFLREIERGHPGGAGIDREDVMEGGPGRKIAWDYIERIFFEPYDPTGVFGTPASTASLRTDSEDTDTKLATTPLVRRPDRLRSFAAES